MLAPRSLPSEFVEWNRKYGSPFGKHKTLTRKLSHILSDNIVTKIQGPFSIQPNNNTRIYEYPWAYHVTNILPGMKVLEIGGGLSGFQFVLDWCGCRVVNVDPGFKAKGVGWACDPKSIGTLNGLFKTNVKLINTTLDNAGMVNEQFDRIFSISVIEHFLPEDLTSTMNIAYDLLAPGGYFILTVDLFLNLYPFTSRLSNEYGVNVDIANIVKNSKFNMIFGNKEEIYGFDQFDTNAILTKLNMYLIGDYPVLSQCLVLQK